MVRDLIAQHVHSLKRKKAATPPGSDGLLIERVAPGSVAEAVGMGPGDIIVEIDGAPAGDASPQGFSDPDEQHVYVFHCGTRRELRQLETTGIPLGMKTRRSSAAILGLAERGDAVYEDLLMLWETGAWQDLERACMLLLDPRGKLRNLTRSAHWGTPAMLLLGAAALEQGRYDEGIEIIAEYGEHYSDKWTVDYLAVAHRYMALAEREAGEMDEALDRLAEAFEMYPSKRIAAALEAMTGTAPVERHLWVGREFPVVYRLAPLKGRGPHVWLGKTLDEMAPHQILVVCLLANYRANGPYSEFMESWIRFSRFFPDRLHGLHVITMETSKWGSPGRWFKGEKAARRAGASFELLHDDNGDVTDVVEPEMSPYIAHVRADGVVEREGFFDEVSFWTDMVGAAQSTPVGSGAP